MDAAQEYRLDDREAPRRRWPAPIRFTERRRRPSGEPPPLPSDLRRSGRYWFALAAGVVVFWVLMLATNGVVSGPFERLDQAILEQVARLRSPGLTRVMRTVHALGSDWTLRFPGWAAILVPLVFKRFRHAIVFFGSVLVVRSVTEAIAVLIHRPRPEGVEILGTWQGWSHPSRPTALLAVTLLGMTYALVPQGRWRQTAKWVTAAAVASLAAARVYLAVDHPTDVVVGAIVGVAVPLVAFRLLTPNEVFPVTYRRGRSAHLDVGGARGQAIGRALAEQLGLTVLDVKPFGLGGSAGSTPLRIRVAGDPDTYVFAKLYAANHLRADRWYKLGRTLLYGRLEDEAAFNTVRRLVQYEDYLLRLMHDAGVPSALPYGFVEITPEREYLLVTEFVEGTVELSEAEITDAVIDDALRVVRKLWDAGLAHRDIKPSNVLVRHGTEVMLIDVAFGEARPSPWRQAVDLANMMLSLAVCSDARRVYDRALAFFTPDEIAEAFAATYFGVTSPTQLRGLVRAQGRDLVQEFRSLAPRREPIPIQRVTIRRVGLSLAVFVGGLLATVLVWGFLQSARLL